MTTGLIGKAQKWWEKGLQPNMKEIEGAGDLVESLLNAGDKLVVVEFFSPGCGGCKALHPKVTNPLIIFAFLDIHNDVSIRFLDLSKQEVLVYFRKMFN